MEAPTHIDAGAISANPSRILHFDAWTGGLPYGWERLGEGKIDKDEATKHGDTTSLHLVYLPSGGPVGLKSSRDAATFVDRRWTLTAWVKCAHDGPPKAAVIIGASGEFNETIARAVAEDHVAPDGWSQFTAVVDVPKDAKSVGIGMFVTAPGECLIGDMSEAVTRIPAKEQVSLRGGVLDSSRNPAAGATIGVFLGEDLVATTTTNANGQFVLSLLDGAYAITATYSGQFGQTDKPVKLSDNGIVQIALKNRASLVEVEGVVPSSGEASKASPPIVVSTGNNDVGARSVVFADASGRFSAWLPESRTYWAIQRTDAVLVARKQRRGHERRIDMGKLVSANAATSSVREWLGARAIPVQSVDPASGTMAEIGSLVAGASVVVAGEATHGSAEFSLLKQKLFRYLAEKKGFRTFAIEASAHACDTAKAYVLQGQGTPEDAVNGLMVWPWRTMEVRSTLVWIREWNANHQQGDRIDILCFDAQSSVDSYGLIDKFLQCADPQSAAELMAPINELGPNGRGFGYESDEKARQRVWAGLVALKGRFRKHRMDWKKACGLERVEEAERELRVMELAHGARLDLARIRNVAEGWVPRDHSMAENILSAAQSQTKGGIMVWTHNVHASMDAEGYESMGSRLREKLGSRVLIIGMLFDDGSFQALDAQPDTLNGWIRRFEVPSLGPGSLGSLFAELASKFGADVLAVDLRGRAPKAAAEWLSALHPMWEVGAGFFGRASMTQYVAIRERFDAVLFVRHVTRAIPLH